MPVTVRFDPTSVSQQAQIIPDATLFNDGVMTKEMVARLNDAAPVGAVTVNASPGTNTIAAAISQLPCSYKTDCNIVLAPGVYNETSFINWNLPAGCGPLATTPGLIGGFTPVVGPVSETAGDPTGVTFTNAGLAMTPNAFFGEMITCVSGANAGQQRMVASNTATSVSANQPFNSPISIGDVFQIETPSVIINHVGFAIFGTTPATTFGCFLKGIKFVSAIDSLYGVEIGIAGEGVQVDGQSSFNGGLTLLHKAEFLSNFALNTFVNPLSQADWFFRDGFVFMNDGCFCPGFNNNMFLNTSLIAANGCIYNPSSIVSKNSDFTLLSSRMSSGGNTLPSVLDGDNGSGYIILCDKQSGLGTGFSALDNMVIQNSSGDAILVQGGSVGNIGNISGAGNTGFGINATNMAMVRVNQDGGTTTVTGGAGDTNVGSTPKTYAGLPFSEVDGTGPTLCRIQF